MRLVLRGGDALDRDEARRLVTTHPSRQVNALRGLKQAFERAQRNTTWDDTELYLASYQDSYSGVTSIGLHPGFAATLADLLFIDA